MRPSSPFFSGFPSDLSSYPLSQYNTPPHWLRTSRPSDSNIDISHWSSYSGEYYSFCSSYNHELGLISCQVLSSYRSRMPEQYSLLLKPMDLALAVTPGETYRIVLQRFNAFRAPNRQIQMLYHMPPQNQYVPSSLFQNIKMAIDLDTVISHSVTAWIL